MANLYFRQNLKCYTNNVHWTARFDCRTAGDDGSGFVVVSVEINNHYTYSWQELINPAVELAEDAPTDTFHIPANAANKEAALK